MHLRRRRQVTTAGLAVCAVALAACSSSSSSSSSSSVDRRAAAQPRRPAAAPASAARSTGAGRRSRPSSSSRPSRPSSRSTQHDGQLRQRRLGQGPHRPGLGRDQLRGLGHRADPGHRGGELQGQDGAVLPRLHRPDHGLVQPVRRQQPEAGSRRSSRTSSTGKITSWNNSAITALNPGVSLPSTPITTAVRSDSSGTTQNFTLFLKEAVRSVWTLGSSSTIKWPTTARAGAGNPGVAQIIKSTPGAIGYVDYADAKASGLTFASIKNTSGSLRRALAVGGVGGRGRDHHRDEPHVRRGRCSERSAPTRSPTSRGSWCTRCSRTRTTRRCSRPTSAT